MSRLIRTRASVTAAAALVATMLLGATAASAAVSQYFDFNSPGQLAGSFDSYIGPGSGSVTQSETGGIADSGAISARSSPVEWCNRFVILQGCGG